MKAIQLISLQHELGMSIGLELNLQRMLKRFSNVCIRQLGLSSMHYYKFQIESNNGLLSGLNKFSEVEHILSIPKIDDNSQGFELSSAMETFSSGHTAYFAQHNSKTNEYIYYLELENFGIIELHRFNRKIEENIFNLLKPIIKRLTISCQASIEHEHLLQAIEARKEAEQAISHLAFHDELTDLPNRRFFMESLSKDISRSTRHGFYGAVLFLDLNRFKVINDTLGHATGDHLLIEVAQMLKSIVRAEDTVARLSGDEFVIQVSKIAPEEKNRVKAINLMLDKIHQLFSKPIEAGKYKLHVTPSIGVEMYPNGEATADDILHHADTAMYQAKALGGNASSFYDQRLSEGLKLRLELEKELQEAVKHKKHFSLCFQPQFNSIGDCIGAEALIRWNNPKHGFVSPADFIAIAEETGLMLEIGQWVVWQTFEYLQKMVKKGLPKTFKKMSINVSAIQFSQEDFITNLLAIVDKKSVPAELLSIELTESSLIKNIDQVIEIISSLREHGITTSIDDFGTGYSSLAYLSRLPIETLKVDQTFVRGIHADKSNRAIVEAIMALGKSLHVNIIAEGVETLDELNCLQELGCENFQGYYFSRPISFDELYSRDY